VKEFMPVLQSSVLFQGMDETQIMDILMCLTATKRVYTKNAFVHLQGDRVDSLGLVLAGAVFVIQEDFWGNRNIITSIGEGEVFAESYGFLPGVALGVSVEAQAHTTVLFLNTKKVLTTCSNACTYHSRLIYNLVSLLAAKNLRMNEKLQHLSQRTTREKILSFLSAESRQVQSAVFTIPFNRQQLADFLAVDRSAMCSELSKLRNEGILSYHKSTFTLKNNDVH